MNLLNIINVNKLIESNLIINLINTFDKYKIKESDK
jgi:hypothetical protein